MLMDEPFGAIDPINRAKPAGRVPRACRRQVKKTIVFVTHDIDEAIKMGDRIAILRKGGVLAQYDTPEEILARPADDFVAQFVGADRGIKRLSLTTLADDHAARRRDGAAPRRSGSRRATRSRTRSRSCSPTPAGRSPSSMPRRTARAASACGAASRSSHLERLIAEESEREGDGDVAAAAQRAAAGEAAA